MAAGVLVLAAVGALAVDVARGTAGPALSPVLVPAAPSQTHVRLAPADDHAGPTGRRTLSPAWVAEVSSQAGIPAPAVRAYGDAALREARQDPGCHLGWTTLAGLGWVESQHGTLDGRVLQDDGHSDPPVFGPVLDGTHHTAAVRAADGSWERAVGPMQFLPSTWRTWGADGDGDGIADPQDLDDAALAAAAYLCAAGGDLATGDGWSAAVRAYNHSDDYVRAVYDAASAYAQRTAQ